MKKIDLDEIEILDMGHPNNLRNLVIPPSFEIRHVKDGDYVYNKTDKVLRFRHAVDGDLHVVLQPIFLYSTEYAKFGDLLQKEADKIKKSPLLTESPKGVLESLGVRMQLDHFADIMRGVYLSSGLLLDACNEFHYTHEVLILPLIQELKHTLSDSIKRDAYSIVPGIDMSIPITLILDTVASIMQEEDPAFVAEDYIHLNDDQITLQ